MNISLLILNQIFFFYRYYFQKSNIYRLAKFKSSDYFNINLYKKSFVNISNYLNIKYGSFNEENKNISSKKVIKIDIKELSKNFLFNWLSKHLSDKFIIQLDTQNPDYLLYNCYHDHDIDPKYNNTIKIAIYTENIMVDINHADYIIGNYHINYLDRYFKYSIFLWQNFSDINKIREEVLNHPIRNKFCAAVISNCFKVYGFRLKFIELLSKYKKVDMGGKCNNNINRTVNRTAKYKIDFLSNYKFSFAMENSDGDGYISEKIVDSFRAGTIPIYYGDYMIDEFINPKTYILIKGEKDIEKKIDLIKKIDNDDGLYRYIMKEKPIIDDKFINKIELNETKSFLQNIFIQQKNKAYRRDDYYYNCSGK